ncbi:hypothetical protein KEM52_004331, partial [Ascosphaera acerosa]
MGLEAQLLNWLTSAGEASEASNASEAGTSRPGLALLALASIVLLALRYSRQLLAMAAAAISSGTATATAAAAATASSTSTASAATMSGKGSGSGSGNGNGNGGLLPSSRPPLTARERLDMLPALLSVTASGARSTLTGLHRNEKHARTHGLHVRYAIMRKAITRMTAKQLRQILPPSNKMYEHQMRKHGMKPDTVEVGENALGHWVGDKINAENVMIFFH